MARSPNVARGATRSHRSLRHPQHVGLGIVVMGHVLRWPSPLAITACAPLLALIAVAARRDDREAEAAHGDAWAAYAARTPSALPGLRRRG